MGESTSGGISLTPPMKPTMPPMTAAMVSSEYRRKDFTRSSRFTRPFQSRRSVRCSGVSDARCGGSISSAPSARGAIGDAGGPKFGSGDGRDAGRGE